MLKKLKKIIINFNIKKSSKKNCWGFGRQSHIYLYKKLGKEFAGKINSIMDSDTIILEDKNENLSSIPLSEISVIIKRR